MLKQHVGFVVADIGKGNLEDLGQHARMRTALLLTLHPTDNNPHSHLFAFSVYAIPQVLQRLLLLAALILDPPLDHLQVLEGALGSLGYLFKLADGELFGPAGVRSVMQIVQFGQVAVVAAEIVVSIRLAHLLAAYISCFRICINFLLGSTLGCCSSVGLRVALLVVEPFIMHFLIVLGLLISSAVVAEERRGGAGAQLIVNIVCEH